MSQDELEVIDKVASSYKRLMKVGCTGCAYCMPCPAGVNIPQCFAYYNHYSMASARMDRLMAQVMYGLSVLGGYGTPMADASLCRNCGKCVKACPQKIAIPAELKNVNTTMNVFSTKLATRIISLLMSRMNIEGGER
jgi:predicted aldo/keto reductase-like oxidoreductase